MIVAPGIIDEIFEFYLACYDEELSVNRTVVRDSRKKLKIIVDTMYEQSVENITGEKPRNPMDARYRINRYLEGGETECSAFLRALNDVLSHYDVLSDKRYIDHSKDLQKLLEGPLNNLCDQLCSRDCYASISSARALKKFLGRL